MADAKRSSERGYPLSTLFLLIAAVAVLLGMVAPALHRPAQELHWDELFGASLSSGMGLALVGFCVGLFQHRRWRGAWWGVLLGGVLGMLSGPIVAVPWSGFPQVLLSSLCGALLVVGVAAAIRWNSGRTPPPAACDAAPAKRHPLDPDGP
jgi:hypothetical protein